MAGSLPVRLRERIGRCAPSVATKVDAFSYAGALAMLALCVVSLSSGTYNPFIYFRF